MIRENATVADLVNDPDLVSFSRIPIRGGSRDEVTGYILYREAVAAAVRGGRADLPLHDFKRRVRFLPETASLHRTLEFLLHEREAMTIVVDEFGGVSGLVTLEDVIETLLGTEIVDETDREVDLRQAAAHLRDRRLERAAPRPVRDVRDRGAGSAPDRTV
jgi:CBS domain containing-hemolysin-like protein